MAAFLICFGRIQTDDQDGHNRELNLAGVFAGAMNMMGFHFYIYHLFCSGFGIPAICLRLALTVCGMNAGM